MHKAVTTVAARNTQNVHTPFWALIDHVSYRKQIARQHSWHKFFIFVQSHCRDMVDPVKISAHLV